MRSLSALGIVGLALAASACEPASPAMPTFTKDVGPIFAAHCTRCHGAGGTLQGDPVDYPLGKMPEGYLSGPPIRCHFEVYDDIGDCNADPNCGWGAGRCGPLLPQYIGMSMPPPPAAALSDWEMDILKRWSANPLR